MDKLASLTQIEQQTSAPLRILLVVNLPWDGRLGAVRVYMELSECWRQAGHIVEVYSLSDAFPRVADSGASFSMTQVLFAYKAAAFVRRNSHRFDVVDSIIGSLHGTKKSLRFDGLLVARSVGLPRLYEKYAPRRPAASGPRPERATLAGRVLYKLINRWRQRVSDSAIASADLVNVLNEEEARCLRENSNLSIEVQPNGLIDRFREALAAAALSPEQRLAEQRVSFIGMWSPRKGAWDWSEIVRSIWRVLPEVKFRFLGTMMDPPKILADLGIRQSERIEIVSQFSPNELPQLLSDCTVGVFPSHIEGFGLAVLEQLAAGIPTIAFEVPGPAHTLKDMPRLLVPAGDVQTIAQRAVELLQSSPEDYRNLTEQCLAISAQYRWERVAEDTIEHYRHYRSRLTAGADRTLT